ncbi:hypothetical protein HA075_13105 [bacterium BFN5]|nr:hypothetical protein HA075_13105 [bacterium BFN5]
MNKKLGTAFWLITIIAAFIVLLNLGAIPLLDPDEPVYAQTPKEMMHHVKITVNNQPALNWT